MRVLLPLPCICVLHESLGIGMGIVCFYFFVFLSLYFSHFMGLLFTHTTHTQLIATAPIHGWPLFTTLQHIYRISYLLAPMHQCTMAPCPLPLRQESYRLLWGPSRDSKLAFPGCLRGGRVESMLVVRLLSLDCPPLHLSLSEHLFSVYHIQTYLSSVISNLPPLSPPLSSLLAVASMAVDCCPSAPICHTMSSLAKIQPLPHRLAFVARRDWVWAAIGRKGVRGCCTVAAVGEFGGPRPAVAVGCIAVFFVFFLSSPGTSGFTFISSCDLAFLSVLSTVQWD